MRIHRWHDLALKRAGDTLVNGAVLRITADDCCLKLPMRPEGIGLDVQSQLGLAGIGVGTMARVTVFGQDRPHIAVETDLRNFTSRGCNDRKIRGRSIQRTTLREVGFLIGLLRRHGCDGVLYRWYRLVRAHLSDRKYDNRCGTQGRANEPNGRYFAPGAGDLGMVNQFLGFEQRLDGVVGL